METLTASISEEKLEKFPALHGVPEEGEKMEG